NHIYKFSIKNNNDIDKARNEAFGISRFYLWKNLMQNYDTVYKLALDRYSLRLHVLEHLLEIEPDTSIELADSNEPILKSAIVQYKVPEALKNLDLLSRNLWWTWNYEAEGLFSSIDTKLWEQVNHNPIALLGSLSYKRFLELERDEEFITNLNKITEKFKTYLAQDTKKSDPLVAYMCMEYGLHESLPLYSGGLGVLAGDYLKEASDRNINMVAFGLLYRYGYFNQSLT